MKDLIKETPAADDFDLIELGSVSEETRGGPINDYEVESGSLNSYQ